MRVKALFLLTIFMLNTAVGFCCALHLFHKDHEEDTEHHHTHPSVSSVGHHHHHQSSAPTLATVSKDEPCCQGAVNNFASLAKLLPQSVNIDTQLPVAFITFYRPYAFITLPGVPLKGQHFVVKRQRPPTQNIRIAIQSFQI